jgi:hypothetical protein
MRENPYHVPIIRLQLTQALPLLVPEVYDEVVMACNEFIPVNEGKCLNHLNIKTDFTIVEQSGRVFVSWIR